jgi:GrpB-like predicted nucleotidyltransferase (UPF0157 family)
MKKVRVVPHDPNWRVEFEAEKAAVADALEPNALAIHHIGSTSITGIYAKPVIDILVEVSDIADVDANSAALVSLGYEAVGEFGIPGRRYFRKDDVQGDRTHQIHAFETGSDQITRHLAFRDYMLDHPDEAQEYSKLKRRLADLHPDDAEAYMDGKDDFIKETDHKAAIWRAIITDPDR